MLVTFAEKRIAVGFSGTHEPLMNVMFIHFSLDVPCHFQVRNSKGIIMQDLETALAAQAPPSQQDVAGLHELPPLIIDGIPTPVDKMTQVLNLKILSTFSFHLSHKSKQTNKISKK